jgi:fructokinase
MSVVCIGELLIDFVALESGVTVGEASGFQKVPGGGVANVAVAVARLGASSAFLGQVGNDPFGHFLQGALEQAGVDAAGLRFSDEARTMLAFVSLAAGGERSFVFYRHPSADMYMRPADVDLDLIARHKMLHFSSITLINEPARSATLAGVNHALQSGLQISFDPNLRLNLWPDADSARQAIQAALPLAHIVKLSEEELDFLGGDLTALWQGNTRLIAVTRGAGGASLYTPDRQVDLPGFSVAPVDTTGAGDGFVGGLLVGLLEQGAAYADHLESILRLANAVCALATTQRGAFPAMPTRDTVENLIANN